MMFKVLVSQTTNNLSDERAEFLINDHLSFMHFLDLVIGLLPRREDAAALAAQRTSRSTTLATSR